MFNTYSGFRGKSREKSTTLKEFAEKMGVSYTSLKRVVSMSGGIKPDFIAGRKHYYHVSKFSPWFDSNSHRVKLLTK